MKSLSIMITFAGILGAACLVRPQVGSPTSNVMVRHVGSDYAIFYNPPTATFYLFQFNTAPAIPNQPVLVSFAPQELRLSDSNTKKPAVYSLSNNVYGIASMSGEGYQQRLLTGSGASLAFVSDIDTALEEVSCKCYRDNGRQYKDCDSGGEGANGCEVTDGGGVATANWQHHCQVSCHTGYYACCNKK